MPVIKRYPNRKLYDTDAKRYVTLEGVAELIRSGQEIEVVDYETGEDLTNLTLSQIILEQERRSAGFLPRSVLTSLIRTGGDTLEYLRRSLGTGVANPPPSKSSPRASGQTTGQTDAESEWALLHLVDEQLAGILHHLNVPSYKDLKQLQEQVRELTRQLNTLSSRLESAPADPAADDSPNSTSAAGSQAK